MMVGVNIMRTVQKKISWKGNNMQRTFGRLYKPDPRSRDFPIRSLFTTKKVRSYTWKCGIVLDQGDRPACVGFSVAHEIAARPVAVRGITGRIALNLYELAKELDEFDGEDYDGSTVNGGMKAGRKKGYYGEWRWASNVGDLALAIGYHGPAVLGIGWYEGMMDPDTDGIIYPAGLLQGGHAILCNGYNVKTGLFRLHNSWGKNWGLNGECFISTTNMQLLLREDGEAAIPLKRMGR